MTPERLKQLLHYDPSTGHFTRVGKSWTPLGSRSRGRSCGPINVRLDGRNYPVSRLAFLYMTGQWPKFMADHINGDNRDNRWSNLRDVPNQVNLQNQRRPKSNNKSGYLGVSWHTKEGRFRASIKFDGKVKHLGYFDDPKEAHAVYVEVKRKVHAGCTL